MNSAGAMAKFAMVIHSSVFFAGAEERRPLRFSVSGQSAGGSMAVNHLFAFSSHVDGATIAAGSPYGCGVQPDEEDRCYYGHVDINASIAWAYWRYQQGLIDNPAHLKNVPVLLFNGKDDECVYTRVMKDTFEQLRYFVDERLLFREFGTNAAHVWSLDHGGCDCGTCSDFEGSLECCDVNNCHYDLSGDMLRKIYGEIKPRKQVHGNLAHVEQWKYLPKDENLTNFSVPRFGLWRFALVYVPTNCKERVESCRIHVNYHGCILKVLKRRRLWATSIDLNEYGEANDIIMVYPQAAGSESEGIGCWNWGDPKTDPNFDTRRSVQLRTVMNLLEDLPQALRLAKDQDLVDGFEHNSSSPSILV